MENMGEKLFKRLQTHRLNPLNNARFPIANQIGWCCLQSHRRAAEYILAHPTFEVIKDTREYLRSDAVARLCRFHQKEQRIERINETRRSPTDQREVIDIIVLRLPI